MKDNLNFGQALEALENRQLVSREGWNGKGMFLFLRGSTDFFFHPNSSNNDVHIPDLPTNVMDKLRPDTSKGLIINGTAYLCMKAADGSIVRGWLASQTDMLAKDWCILD